MSPFNRRTFIKVGSVLSLPLLLPTTKLKAGFLNSFITSPEESAETEWKILNKISYGPKREELLRLKKIGLEKYLEEQLNAPLEDDKNIQQRLSALKLDIKYQYNGYNVDEKRCLRFLDMSIPECRKHFESIKEKGWHEWIRPAMEVASANWIKAVYSKWQIHEMMVEFWHNHFNVTINANMEIGSCIPSYDRDVIRKNVFGNFRVFLEDVAKSPAMLYYLNNKASQASPANENYARELFELHTLGEEHYFNNLYDKWRDVPGALEGKPVGYIDEDVYEAARAFTGWTIADGSSTWRSGVKEDFPDSGEFYYFDGFHDNYQKRVLGYEIKSNQPPMADGKDVLDLLAAHPGTAKHLCRKIIKRFLGDTYPDSLLQKAQDTWMKNLDHPHQIKLTLETIFKSDEFLHFENVKVKRPYEFVVSIARLTNSEFTPNMMLHWITSSLGYKPLMWPSPAGPPDKDTYWMGPGAMLRRWKAVGTILYWKEFEVFKFDFTGNTPQGLSHEQILDHWSERITGKKIKKEYREEIIKIFAEGKNPQNIPMLSRAEMEPRLISLAQFLFSTPEFQIR
ncbi:MAG TPA: DUF1800 domain-containing protein [Cytophagaceae bacterium]|jgi:uncharacterized protein (DUF1800 family)|nr:DUF1800 domain-containing protein [Cytophagaceae bacterium]